MDKVYRQLLEQGWKMPEIDNADIFDMIRIMNDEKEAEVEKTESMLDAFM